MANLIWMLLYRPLSTLGFLYCFVTLSSLEVLKRTLLPQVPAYQSLRIRLFRAYLIACSLHYPELVHRLPSTASSTRAKLVETTDFKAYCVPGTENLSSLAANGVAADTCVVLYGHGGGYAKGEARMYLRYMERWVKLAKERGLKLIFLTVEYPLTDRAAHPAQLNSFFAAYHHLLGLGIPSSRIVFMGDSAGGGLCILTGRRALQESLDQPAGYVLVSPWIDHAGESFEGGNALVETDYVVTANAMVPRLSSLFLGGLPPHSPETNPLLLDSQHISGLSRQLILVGAGEFCLPEVCRWASCLEKAGVEHVLIREQAQMHIYAMGSRWMPFSVRNKTDLLIIDWILECLKLRK